jgi:hypothetical protein
MKIRLFLIMGLLCLTSGKAFALSFMGPPTAELNQAQYRVGYIYSYSIQDLEKVRRDWIRIGNDTIISTGEGQVRLEDLSVQRHYVGLNVGFMDWWEVYVRLGLSDVKSDIHWFDEERKAGYNFDNDFAWGWGTKVTFQKNDTVAWGVSLHMNWLDTSASITEDISESGPWRDKVSIDTYDTLLVVGPTIDMGGWKLYGGPFYYRFDGDYEYERNFFELNYIEKEDAQLEEDGSFGAFIGTVVDLAEKSDLTAELSFTSEGWAAGAGIAQRF